MAIEYKNVFSNYEIKETAIKFEGEETFEKIGCVGSIDESLEVITVTKKCEGIVIKSTTRATGNGEITVSLHMRYDLYTSIFPFSAHSLNKAAL